MPDQIGETMKITVVGATGATGSEVLRQAIERGHDVRAVVRSPQHLSIDVPWVAMDLASDPDPDMLASALAGQDAVVSALGPRSRADAGVAAPATAALIAAMTAAGVRRLVVISAAPIGTVPSPGRPNPPRHDPGDGPLVRYLLNPIVKRVYRDVYADLARMEDAVRAGGRDWTIVRPPRLLDGPRTGSYRTSTKANLRGGASIRRADLADAMLDALDLPATVGAVLRVAT